ncbi:MAG: hypothetical protein ABI592_14425 [Acidobacteriota bacterium]
MRRPHAAAIAAVALAAACAGCRERGRPDPDIRMAVSHDREAPEGPAAAAGAPEASGAAGSETAAGEKVPTRLEVPPSVQKAYSGIRVRWKDSGSGKEGTIEIPIGSSVAVPETTLQVRGDVFLPSFTMTSDVITSTGIEPENPAARISVADNGSEVFGGWIFTRFPDVHPFQHPRISLRLEGGVRRNS